MESRLARILPTVSKPGRYTGGEWNSIVKDWSRTPVRLALAYPEVYEVGMSNLGLAILYDVVNRLDYALAERSFAPWPDMEQAMRACDLPLYSLESHRPLGEFDIVGFSLGYELTYTNVLGMLGLAGIPVLAAQRGERDPLVIGGGTCCLNAEPLADFFDLFALGEGEEILVELLELFRQTRDGGVDKEGFLERAARIPGVYVPRFYRVRYGDDGRVQRIEPERRDVPARVTRRMCEKLPPHISRPIVPYLEPVHDRAAVEIQRGCTRGCRFCQAGNVYRPVRERPVGEVLETVDQLLANTGYEELSLISLSSSDYSQIEPLVRALRERYDDRRLNISLPSLRIDGFSVRLAELVQSGKKSGFTFAPEAGSQKLRDVMAKGITEEEILNTAREVLKSGWSHLKLYFMVGLPEETEEDVRAIVYLARKIWRLGRELVGSKLRISVSVATFIPKPHTPFQWCAQSRPEELAAKHTILRDGLRQQGLHLSWHDPQVSLLEAVLSRGDRRLGPAILQAWRAGCRFDGWHEHFRPDLWWQALRDNGLDPSFYAHRERDEGEVLPWSHVDSGVTPAYFRLERQAARAQELVEDCRNETCNTCGLQRISPRCLARATERAKVPRTPDRPAADVLDDLQDESQTVAQSPAPGHAAAPVATPTRGARREAQNTPVAQRLRVGFAHGEPVRFISHLDVMRLWHRAIRRAGLPLVYSSGFSPHPRLIFASPLPTGVTGDWEMVDVFLSTRLDPDEVCERLDEQMPFGVDVRAVTEVPVSSPPLPSLVRFADYVVLTEEHMGAEELEAAVRRLLAAETLPRERRRDKDVRRYDLRPLIADIPAYLWREDVIRIHMRLRSDSSASGRPEEVTAALGFQERPQTIHRLGLILDSA